MAVDLEPKPSGHDTGEQENIEATDDELLDGGDEEELLGDSGVMGY